jgi:4-hydroxythreonine-4-phosphate dehydrogenase
MTITTSSPVLAVTPGEPAGIGPEIAVKLSRQHPDLRLLFVADPDCLRRAAQSLHQDLALAEWRAGTEVLPGIPYCLPVRMPCAETPGRPDPRNARYVLDTLREAVQLVRGGQAAALVTGPVHKAVINQAGIAFSGHTEFLAGLAGVEQVVMMLAAPGLRVALVTTHLPLRQVADAITRDKVEKVIRITARELQQRFGIARPRLQVLGLNPHAGEQGHLGLEDGAIIRPAIEACRSDTVLIEGPVPADTAFTPPRLADCDAVIAMYHDQGLPVLKHFGFGRSVNITLGLPFIRTSVDHGTALEIAGSGSAQAGSFYQAAEVAMAMARHQSPRD